MSSSLQWGTTPATPPAATLDPANGLQPIVNAIAAAANGGIIDLGDGFYYADPANPATPLTIPAGAYNLRIRGRTAQGTIIGSPVLWQAGKMGLSDLHIDPPAGSAYGLKIYNGGSPFLSRHMLERIIIGDRGQAYAQGPTKGLHIDGGGVLQATQCTFAFCAGNGLYVDSTGTEPNTTLQFDMCSFVGNGEHGIHLLGSCSLAEFRGGNSEQNGRSAVPGVPSAWRELFADSMNGLIVHAFDFETDPDGGVAGTRSLDNAVEVISCRPVSFTKCNFEQVAGKATRALIISGSDNVEVLNNKFGNWTSVGVVRLSEDSRTCDCHGNQLSNNCWIEDYSR